MKTRTLRTLVVIAAAVFLVFSATNASAALIASGTLSAGNGNLVRSNSAYWANAVLNWSTDQTGSLFTYTYDFNTNSGEAQVLSHITIETSPGFAEGDVLSGTTSGWEVGPDGSATPVDGTLSNIYGIKWDGNQSGSLTTVTLLTYRTPVWGDVFLKDGQVDAWNSGYALEDPTTAVTGNWTSYGWLGVPDTTVIPIPGAVWLLGSGLLGLVAVRRKMKK